MIWERRTFDSHSKSSETDRSLQPWSETKTLFKVESRRASLQLKRSTRPNSLRRRNDLVCDGEASKFSRNIGLGFSDFQCGFWPATARCGRCGSPVEPSGTDCYSQHQHFTADCITGPGDDSH